MRILWGIVCVSCDCIVLMYFSIMNFSNDDKSVLSIESFYVFIY